MHNTEGAVHELILETAAPHPAGLLDRMTVVERYERRFADRPRNRRLDDAERDEVLAALERYKETAARRGPGGARSPTTSRTSIGTGGFGIGSAGLPAYNVLLEGYDEALENDVVLSVKQGNVAAPSRIVDRPGDPRRTSSTRATGRRRASGRCSRTPRSSSATPRSDGAGFVVAELSPYELDLDWDDLTEPDEIRPVLVQLGRATAKLHCVGDADSDHTLVPFQTEEAITAMIGGRREEFVADLVEFAHAYAAAHAGGPPAVRRRLPRRPDPRDQLERAAPWRDVDDHAQVRADARLVVRRR